MEDVGTWVAVAGGVISLLAVVGGVIARDRVVFREISAVRDHADDGDKTLHERVNKTREDFVRRDDLAEHMGRLERGQAEMAAEQRRTNKRIDEVLKAFGTAQGT